jgi:hypothetical protein
VTFGAIVVRAGQPGGISGLRRPVLGQAPGKPAAIMCPAVSPQAGDQYHGEPSVTFHKPLSRGANSMMPALISEVKAIATPKGCRSRPETEKITGCEFPYNRARRHRPQKPGEIHTDAGHT